MSYVHSVVSAFPHWLALYILHFLECFLVVTPFSLPLSVPLPPLLFSLCPLSLPFSSILSLFPSLSLSSFLPPPPSLSFSLPATANSSYAPITCSADAHDNGETYTADQREITSMYDASTPVYLYMYILYNIYMLIYLYNTCILVYTTFIDVHY